MDMKIIKNYYEIRKMKILGSLIFLPMHFFFSETVLGTGICSLANIFLLKIMPASKYEWEILAFDVSHYY